MYDALLLILALLGHVALWVTLYNQLHARAIPHKFVQKTNLPIYLAITAIPLLVAAWYLSGGDPQAILVERRFSAPAAYVLVCDVAGVIALVDYLLRVQRPPASRQLSNHTTHVDLLAELGDRYDGPSWPRKLATLPFNQLLELSIHEKEIEIPRLPAELDGLSIAHLSDLHFTGKVGKAWFEEVVRRTDALNCDLIAVTGDICDKERTFPWIADTLGRLRAPLGVYYVLGNHDLRVDHRRLRELLTGQGLIDLGSRWIELPVRGQRVVLAGNELPWFPPAADLETAPKKDATGLPLRIVLAHSPDQLNWACRHDVDLMMVGHTHGGQWRAPLIGPVVTSSLIGARYAAGTYYRPPTVMHVTRGLSGTILFRFNCPPELTRLVLRAPRAYAANPLAI